MKKYCIAFLIGLLLVSIYCVVSAKLEPVSYIINNVPELLEIQDFSFKIISYDDKYQFKTTVRNNSSQKIEAYGISFLVFDYFNEKKWRVNWSLTFRD